MQQHHRWCGAINAAVSLSQPSSHFYRLYFGINAPDSDQSTHDLHCRKRSASGATFDDIETEIYLPCMLVLSFTLLVSVPAAGRQHTDIS